LTLVRFREFMREPEALFWVFGFPILLAAGLGIAFRNRPPEVLQMAAVTPQLAAALRAEKLLDVRELAAPDAETALRNGKVVLVAEPGANGAVVYRFDDTNPEGRSARMLADRAVQRSAGRQDPMASSDA
jgi:ABC-2 type transport system permease protein